MSEGLVDESSFGVRGNGNLIIFDVDGYFTVVKSAEGIYFLRAADGATAQFYCEPIWLSGYFDHFHEMYGEA